jgi:hypothetical protein
MDTILNFSIKADTQQGQAALAKFTDALKTTGAAAESSAQQGHAAYEKFTGGVSQLGDVVVENSKKIAAGMAIAGTAIEAFMGLAVKAFSQAEEASLLFENALKATGGVAGVTTGQINALAAELQRTTKFQDDAVVSAGALLLRFKNIGSDIFPQVIKTAANLAVVMGTDLQEATFKLGRALDMPAEGFTLLQRAGIRFTDAEKDLIKNMAEAGDVAGAQGVILQRLAVMNDAATDQAKGFAGQLSQLANEFNNVQEVIGGVIAGALAPLVLKLKEAMITAQDWAKENPNLTSGVVLMTGAVGGLLLGLAPIVAILPNLVNGFTVLGAAFGLTAGGGLAVLIAGVAAAFALLWVKMDDIKTQFAVTTEGIKNLISALKNSSDAIPSWAKGFLDAFAALKPYLDALRLLGAFVKSSNDEINDAVFIGTKMQSVMKESAAITDKWSRSLADEAMAVGKVTAAHVKTTAELKAEDAAAKLFAKTQEEMNKLLIDSFNLQEKVGVSAFDTAEDYKDFAKASEDLAMKQINLGEETKRTADAQTFIAAILSGDVKRGVEVVSDKIAGPAGLTDAWKTLGTISVDEARRMKDGADLAFKAVALDAASTAQDIVNAFEVRNQKIAAIDAQLGVQAKAASKEVSNAWLTQVSTIFTDMSRGMAKSIVEWKGFGQTLIDVAKTFAEGMLRILFENLFKPFQNALSGLFGGASTAGGSATGGGGLFAGLLGSGGGLGSLIGLNAVGKFNTGSFSSASGALGAGGGALGGGLGGALFGLSGTGTGISSGIGAGGGLLAGLLGAGSFAGPIGLAVGLAAAGITALITKVFGEKGREKTAASQQANAFADTTWNQIIPGVTGGTMTSAEGMKELIAAHEAYNAWLKTNTNNQDVFNRSVANGNVTFESAAAQLKDLGEKAAVAADAQHFGALADDFIKTGKMSDEFASAITKAGGSFQMFTEAAGKIQGLQGVRTEFQSLNDEIKKLLPQQTTMIQNFLTTGVVTAEMAAKIKLAGGNLADFQKFADVKKVKDGFQGLIDTFTQTGQISGDLVKTIQQYGGPQTMAQLQNLQKLMQQSGFNMKDLSDTSTAAGKALKDLFDATSTGINKAFTDSATKLSDTLDKMDQNLGAAIGKLQTAMVTMINDLINVILKIPGAAEQATKDANAFLAGLHAVNIPIHYVPDYRTEPGDLPGGSYQTPPARMARGGIVTGPTVALIGEAGPEAVVPLKKGGMMGTMVINIHAPNVVDTAGLSKLVVKAVDEIRRSGTNQKRLRQALGLQGV